MERSSLINSLVVVSCSTLDDITVTEDLKFLIKEAKAVVEIYSISPFREHTTLQSVINAKLSQQRFWHCYENGLIKTIQTITHNLYVSVKLTSLLLRIKAYPGLY